MKLLKLVFHEFIHGGHLVAAGPTIIILVFIVITGSKVPWELIGGVYLITYIVHLFDRYFDIKNDSCEHRKAHFEKYKNSIPTILITAIILLILLIIQSGIITLLFALLLIFSGIAYSIFLKNLTRYIIGFKSYFTAAIFASVVFFAAFSASSPIDEKTILIFIFFFIRWFANTIFCDIKDIAQDSGHGLKTFAIVFGKNKYGFFSSVNIISSFPIIFGVMRGALPIYSLLLLTTIPYYFYYLKLSRKEDANFQKLSNMWADGESIIWLLAMLIGVSIWG